MKYVKLYDTHTEHEAAKSELMKLDYACTYCKDQGDSWFWYKKEDEEEDNPYKDDYLQLEVLADGDVNVLYSCSSNSSTFQYYYKVNDNNWTIKSLRYNSSTYSLSVSTGDIVYFKSTRKSDFSDGTYITLKNSTVEFNVRGNIMSLLYGDDFKQNETTINTAWAFANLFYKTKVINAKYLNLPATTLGGSCYNSMFSYCSLLINTPKLPATTLAYQCYSGMFMNCTSLTTAPKLPATTLVNRCYPSMFAGCTSLTTAPELPATTLTMECYSSMFRFCTSLTTAPELPATTLAYTCYHNMFNGCSNLTYIKAMFTTTPSNSYTQNWVNGVAASGTFVKNSAATWNVTGVHGIPEGWTVQTANS